VQQKWTKTELCLADMYLDDMSYAIDRDEFMLALANEELDKHSGRLHGWMMAVDIGEYSRMTVAAIAENEGEAAVSFEEWCRNNDRLIWINEDEDTTEEEWGIWECDLEQIPAPVIMMPAELGGN